MINKSMPNNTMQAFARNMRTLMSNRECPSVSLEGGLVSQSDHYTLRTRENSYSSIAGERYSAVLRFNRRRYSQEGDQAI